MHAVAPARELPPGRACPAPPPRCSVGCARRRASTSRISPLYLPYISPTSPHTSQARKYFAHALELKPAHNLRALYGLLLCCAATGGSKTKAAKERDTAELLAFVRPAIKEEYAACGNAPMLKLVEGMLLTLGEA